MSTQRDKFELFTRLQSLGFTYDEAASLRRIEMTLRRWAEKECNGVIFRDEKTGKPFQYLPGYYKRDFGPNVAIPAEYPLADREAGALKRCVDIVANRNARNPDADPLIHYHQGYCRGCMLYLLKRSDIRPGEDIGSIYNRGIAVCC